MTKTLTRHLTQIIKLTWSKTWCR